jgi:hypothetical protein
MHFRMVIQKQTAPPHNRFQLYGLMGNSSLPGEYQKILDDVAATQRLVGHQREIFTIRLYFFGSEIRFVNTFEKQPGKRQDALEGIVQFMGNA